MTFRTGVFISVLSSLALMAEAIIYVIFEVGTTLRLSRSGLPIWLGCFVWLIIMTITSVIAAPLCGLLEQFMKKRRLGLYAFVSVMVVIALLAVAWPSIFFSWMSRYDLKAAKTVAMP